GRAQEGKESRVKLRVLKFLPRLAGIVILVLVAAAGVSFLWVQRHKNELVAARQEGREEGRAFAAGRNATECVAEARKRMTHADSFVAREKPEWFLIECLNAAQPDPEICDGVPPVGQVMATAKWVASSCTDNDDRRRCARILGSIQEHCHGRGQH